jgi:glycerol uptake facilitator-like aquaporin
LSIVGIDLPRRIIAEAVGTALLVATVVGSGIMADRLTDDVAVTASTSFANPAVAIARAVSNTFAGIRPIDVPGFIAAELFGAPLAMALVGWLLANPKPIRLMKTTAE